ncbi:hypothetical protein GCM10028895_03130 [Pontibacter rugosus]
MEDLQKLKLELEIQKLKTPWYTSPEFWKVIIPTVAALVTLYFTFGRGIIDSEKLRLEIQKETLKLEITQFEIKKNDLIKSITQKDSIKQDLENQLKSIRTEKSSLTQRIISLKNDINKSQGELKIVNADRIRDKEFYQAKLVEQYKNERERLSELSKLTENLNNKEAELAGALAEIDYIKDKYPVIIGEENNKLNIVRNEAIMKQLDRQLNRHKQSLKDLQIEYEKRMKEVEKMSDEQLVREFEIYFLKAEADKK